MPRSKPFRTHGPVSLQRMEPSDVVPFLSYTILLLGLTGCGKSNFVECLANNHSLAISGDQLSGVTQEVVGYRAVNLTNGAATPVFVVDTPGLCDPDLSEMSVIRMVIEWMKKRQSVAYVDAVLYFHRISDIRVPRSQRNMINLFKTLLGKRKSGKVGVITTMWDNMQSHEQRTRAESRLNEYDAAFWKGLFKKNIPVLKFHNSHESALEVLNGIDDRQSRIGIFISPFTGERFKHSVFAEPLRVLLNERIEGLEFTIRRLDQDLREESTTSNEELYNLLSIERENALNRLRALETEVENSLPVIKEEQSLGQTLKTAFLTGFLGGLSKI